MDLSSLAYEYLNYLEFDKKSSIHTLKNYRYYISKFIEFHESYGKPQINQGLIEKYQQDLKKQFVVSTQNYFLIALRSFFDYLSSQKNIHIVKKNQIKLSSQKRLKPDSIDQSTFEKLLKQIDLSKPEGLRDYLLVQIIFYTGLKVRELSNLNIDQIDRLTGSLIISDKHGSERKFELPEKTTILLQKYLGLRKYQSVPLFVRFKGTRNWEGNGQKMRLSPRSIERLIKKYQKRTNIVTKVTPLVLRHSYAFKELENGKTLENLQKNLGHVTKNSTRVYQ